MLKNIFSSASDFSCKIDQNREGLARALTENEGRSQVFKHRLMADIYRGARVGALAAGRVQVLTGHGPNQWLANVPFQQGHPERPEKPIGWLNHGLVCATYLVSSPMLALAYFVALAHQRWDRSAPEFKESMGFKLALLPAGSLALGLSVLGAVVGLAGKAGLSLAGMGVGLLVGLTWSVPRAAWSYRADVISAHAAESQRRKRVLEAEDALIQADLALQQQAHDDRGTAFQHVWEHQLSKHDEIQLNSVDLINFSLVSKACQDTARHLKAATTWTQIYGAHVPHRPLVTTEDYGQLLFERQRHVRTHLLALAPSVTSAGRQRAEKNLRDNAIQLAKKSLAKGEPSSFSLILLSYASEAALNTPEAKEVVQQALADRPLERAYMQKQTAASLSASWTALGKASHGGLQGILELMVTAEIDLNEQDQQGFTALARAAQRGDISSMSAFLAANTRPISDQNIIPHTNQTLLHLAVAGGHPKCLQALLTQAQQHQPNEFGAWLEQVDNRNFTALAQACKNKQVDCVKLLLKAGTAFGSAAQQAVGFHDYLLQAVQSGATDLVDLLLQHGADPNAGNPGSYPIHAAIQEGHCLANLLRAKTDLTVLNERGQTPLWLALRGFYSKDPDRVGMLLDAGADPNASIDAAPSAPSPLAFLIDLISQGMPSSTDLRAVSRLVHRFLRAGAFVSNGDVLLMQSFKSLLDEYTSRCGDTYSEDPYQVGHNRLRLVFSTLCALLSSFPEEVIRQHLPELVFCTTTTRYCGSEYTISSILRRLVHEGRLHPTSWPEGDQNLWRACCQAN